MGNLLLFFTYKFSNLVDQNNILYRKFGSIYFFLRFRLKKNFILEKKQ